MQSFLRQRETGRFYAATGQWVSDLTDGLMFETGHCAQEAAIGLTEPVEILYSFDDRALDFAIPCGSPTHSPVPFRISRPL